MNETMSVRFRVMVILNILPCIVCVLGGVGFSGASMAALVLQVLLLWENYYFTHSIKKMLILDAISFLTMAAANLWSSVHFEGAEEKISILEIQFQFVIWFFCNVLFILGTLIWAFHVRDRKREMYLMMGFFGVAAVLWVRYLSLFNGYLSILNGPFSQEYYGIEYARGEQEIARTDEREGEIVWDDEQDSTMVVIRDRSEKELSSVSEDELPIYPDMIALGQDFYYLYGEDYDEDKEYLVKMNYESQMVSKIACGGINSLVCQDGTLFLGTDLSYGEDTRDCLGFYADSFIRESEFETGNIEYGVKDNSGVLQIGDVKLYEHPGEYFSTNPNIREYPEGAHYTFCWGDGVDEEDRSRYSDSVTRFLDGQNLHSQDRCRVNEYQNGTDIYGVINVGKVSFLGLLNTKTAYAYRMDIETEQLTLVGEWDGVILIFYGGDYVVYEKNDTIYRENVTTGEREELCEVSSKKEEHLTYTVSGGYLCFDEVDDVTTTLRVLPDEK